MGKDSAFCITRNQALIIGAGLVVLLMVLFASYVNSQQLLNRSRAAGADLNPMAESGYRDRVKQIMSVCQNLKGYLAWTKNDSATLQFDRFTGRYYSLDTVNPVVTPPVGQPLAGYCAVSGKSGGNWCEKIPVEPACKADCAWVSACFVCAPKGVDTSLICPHS